MKQKFGVFILLGTIIGGMFGAPLGVAFENSLVGLTIGVLGGVFLGWFAAAFILETQNSKKCK